MPGIFKKILLLILLLFIFAVSLYLAIKISVYHNVKPYIYTNAQDVPAVNTAMVLGAQVFPNQIPSHALANRLDSAVVLYKTKKVNQLLMSGDGRGPYYNEVETMTKYVEQQGVPETAILKDDAGLRTYDSCYRAKNEFLLGKVIIVTQHDHLLRAVYTCRNLGLDAIGLEAPEFSSNIASIQYWQNWGRERAALVLAWFDVHIFNPQ